MSHANEDHREAHPGWGIEVKCCAMMTHLVYERKACAQSQLYVGRPNKAHLSSRVTIRLEERLNVQP